MKRAHLFRLSLAALIAAAFSVGAAPAQTPTPTPAPADAAAPAASGEKAAPVDIKAEEVTLQPRKVLVAKGSGNWDSAFDTLTDTLKDMNALLDKQSIKALGNPTIVYTSTDDNGFTYMAEIPIDQEPTTLPKDMSIGLSPDGKTLKFVHRGSYDNMDSTYEAITNYLDDKKLEAKESFIEEYTVDPLTTAEDKLVINVYVPLK
ncbi:MAG: GyrI-like domain-containing protein [Alphaproteobacteria bacterium]|nr:GyrI-like domain-containing protein [Alphaproteobacteria bacterium]